MCQMIISIKLWIKMIDENTGLSQPIGSMINTSWEAFEWSFGHPESVVGPVC